MKRLMLLDIYGLVYRAFFALPPLTTTRGVPINAAYGFTTMLNKIIVDEKPTHVIACFDKGLPPERREIYPDYKVQRTAMPDELRSQFGIIRRILETLRIPIVELEGQEADDVIATLAALAPDAERQVVTGDLDLLQMIEPGVTALVTRRGISELARYDEAAVRQRFGLEASQLADYRGLKGDPSDNLPGVPGIGEKTATKILQAAGSLDALLADPKLAGTPKLQGLIEQYGEQARACRDVSVLKRDLPVTLDWEAALLSKPDPDELYKLYYELEFKTLLRTMPEPESMAAVKAEEALVGRWLQAGADLSFLEGAQRLALVLGADRLGVATGPTEGWELPIDFWGQLPGCPMVVYDSKRLHRLCAARVVEDPMIGAHLLDSSRSFVNVEDAAQQFLARNLPPEGLGAAAGAAWQLAPVLESLLLERGQADLYRGVELPLTSVLAGMERRGVTVDVAVLKEIGAEVDVSMERLQKEIYELAGEEFNLGSPQQLGVILFEKLGIPGGKRNKTGWGTGVEVLHTLEHPVAAKILEYREVAKLKNTYIDAIPGLVEEDGRLRTQFNQTVTATGRLSSSNPNLQNIPVRGELGRRIRRAFVAEEGKVLLAADYDQIELRLMAHLSGDAAMREAFRTGQDIHDFTAREIFGTSEVSAQQRRVAKSVNFGLLYGMSDFGLAQRLEIPKTQAREMMQAYFARFPSVKAYIAGVLEDGRANGYVSTLLGRRRYMPALRSSNYMQRAAAEREATNAPIQGSAADLMKMAMVRLDPLVPGMLLQIHDELIFEVDAAAAHDLAALVRREMEGALSLEVPLGVSLKWGANWFEVEPFA
ncbi:MAG: DNA polymerase I [Candidatus Eremiobacteraeota bacterium]|nr:DNA polymerase I [Candidatus Eremiobacteraeota bacterium]MCW5867368.1 DNA polymerase I [Candidatus Eremiobacteraeota bacterium]